MTIFMGNDVKSDDFKSYKGRYLHMKGLDWLRYYSLHIEVSRPRNEYHCDRESM